MFLLIHQYVQALKLNLQLYLFMNEQLLLVFDLIDDWLMFDFRVSAQIWTFSSVNVIFNFKFKKNLKMLNKYSLSGEVASKKLLSFIKNTAV